MSNFKYAIVECKGSTKEAFSLGQDYGENFSVGNNFEFLTECKRYFFLMAVEEATEYLTTRDEIINFLEHISLPKVRPKTAFAIGLEGFVLFFCKED